MKLYIEIDGRLRKFEGEEVKIDNPTEEEILFLKANNKEQNLRIQQLLGYAAGLEDSLKEIARINNLAGPGSRRTVDGICTTMLNHKIRG